jgi:DNA-binding winged helix-turn-helix (wHTH) protein/Tol biopolymer transport system component
MPRYTFGPFSLDTEARLLVRDGEPIPMAGKTFDTLVVLVQNRGRLVDKEELLSRVWPGTVVEEANLSQAIFTVRKILGDSPKDPRYIATIAGRGYQFVAPVTELTSEAPQMAEGVHEALLKRYKKLGIGISAAVAALVTLAWFALPRPPKSPAEMTQKRLTFNSSENPVQRAAISPDGKFLAYSDAAGIHVKLLSTGEDGLVPRPTGITADAYWDLDSWFPDSTQLLADAYELGGERSMWTVSVVGAQSPRQLREGAGGFEVSPDGTRIAFRPSSANGREIWVMGIQGDNPAKVLAFGENETLRNVHWSPDGQRLAYIRMPRSSERFQLSVETCDLKGTNRTVVVSVDPFIQDFRWLPEGRIVYARRDSVGSFDGNVWQIGIDNHAGTPISKPKRISAWAGSDLAELSVSADGKRLALLRRTSQAQGYLGELTGLGTHMAPPRRLTNDEASDWPTAWTADSKAVLFVSDRNETWGIYSQGISQETAEPVVTGRQEVDLPRLSPDGAWILFLRGREWGPVSHPNGVMRISARGGAPQLVLETRNYINFECARAPASLCVVLEASQDRKQFVITSFDPLKGKVKILRTINTAPLPTWGTSGLFSGRFHICGFARWRSRDSHRVTFALTWLRPRIHS